jgi:hypothetical protein
LTKDFLNKNLEISGERLSFLPEDAKAKVIDRRSLLLGFF